MKTLIYFLIVLLPLVGKAQVFTVSSDQLRVGTNTSEGVRKLLPEPLTVACYETFMVMGDRKFKVLGYFPDKTKKEAIWLKLENKGWATLERHPNEFAIYLPGENKRYLLEKCTYTGKD